MRCHVTIPLVIAALLLGACAGPGADPGDGGKLLTGQARVDEVEIVFLESFPLQVHAIVRGTLADGCTRLGEIDVERVGQTFEIQIGTERPEEAVCIQVEMEFEETVPLDVYGLPAGDYLVRANGVEAGFSFAQDNVLPAE